MLIPSGMCSDLSDRSASTIQRGRSERTSATVLTIWIFWKAMVVFMRSYTIDLLSPLSTTINISAVLCKVTWRHPRLIFDEFLARGCSSLLPVWHRWNTFRMDCHSYCMSCSAPIVPPCAIVTRLRLDYIALQYMFINAMSSRTSTVRFSATRKSANIVACPTGTFRHTTVLFWRVLAAAE